MSAAPERLHFGRVALLGIGLINGSLALVMRRAGLADEIVACARTEATLAKARALGLADRTTTVPREAVAGADLVVLGTPVGAYGAVAEAMAPGLGPETIVSDVADAVWILAIISLSLAIVNLFPFLPLDGGHIFWAIVEKVRGRPVPFSVMERAGVVGFMLVILLFLVGLTNDIDRLSGEGFRVR